MNTCTHCCQTLRTFVLSLATFLALQVLVVILHEFTHSSMAWFLGDMKSPLDIVWGNPVTMTGWDEGVAYDQILAQGRPLQVAIIGFSPLMMHAVVAGLGIFLMRRPWLFERKWLFQVVYWFVVGNLMELVAYIFMRSFSGHGDIGQFNRGTGLSPWWVFGIGSGILIWGLTLFFRDSLPRLQLLFAKDNPSAMWMLLLLTSFLIFLWGSGLRVMASVTGPQGLFGLIGILAFILTVWLFRPGCSPQKRSFA